MSIGGLRTADSTILSVLTQDVLRRPIGQIDRVTLCDLLALSEVPEQVTESMGRELSEFREQMFREIADLVDGPQLAEFAIELGEVAAAAVPECLRVNIRNLVEQRNHPDSIGSLQATIAGWADTTPTAIALPQPGDVLASISVAPVVTKTPAKKKTRRTRTVVDERREEWIREDVCSRLVNYGSRGLKESIIVAGARHRSPWKDLTEAEVLTILRKLKRENIVRYSAGRWMSS